jgi:hypothetical protein
VVDSGTKRLLYLHDTIADSKLGYSASGRARWLQHELTVEVEVDRGC